MKCSVLFWFKLVPLLAIGFLATGCGADSDPDFSGETRSQNQPDLPSPQTTGGTPEQGEASRNVYQVSGVIQEIRPDENTVVVEHEEIPGYMAAMTMAFDVKDPAELKNLQPGDKITFKMIVTEEDGWIEDITRQSTVEAKTSKRPMVRIVRDVEILEEGDLVPNVQFTNQFGNAVELKDFRGKALAMTFIFTRCPYPDFCPRLSKTFASAVERLKSKDDGAENWHFLSVTIDPHYDTPAVLKQYGETYQYDPDRWSLVTAAMIDIDALTEQFNMATSFDPEKQTINHQLRTAVIDPEGRVQRIFKFNQWTVDELVEEVMKAAQGQ